MPKNNLVERLHSSSMPERVSATYQLDSSAINANQEVLNALRENLWSTDTDLVEITIMRLAIRAKDCHSFDRIAEIFFSSEDGLVLSACAFGLSSLADCEDAFRSKVLVLLSDKLALTNDSELKAIYEKQIEILSN